MMREPTSDGLALADAAGALIGTRFRLHGRDPATGLDCIGLLAVALAGIGRAAVLPETYTLRTRTPDNLDAIAHQCGLVTATAPVRPGDVALVRIAATQLHLLIALAADRFVHAHAGLRQVVVHDGMLGWPLAALWRLNETIED